MPYKPDRKAVPKVESMSDWLSSSRLYSASGVVWKVEYLGIGSRSGYMTHRIRYTAIARKNTPIVPIRKSAGVRLSSWLWVSVGLWFWLWFVFMVIFSSELGVVLFLKRWGSVSGFVTVFGTLSGWGAS